MGSDDGRPTLHQRCRYSWRYTRRASRWKQIGVIGRPRCLAEVGQSAEPGRLRPQDEVTFDSTAGDRRYPCHEVPARQAISIDAFSIKISLLSRLRPTLRFLWRSATAPCWSCQGLPTRIAPRGKGLRRGASALGVAVLQCAKSRGHSALDAIRPERHRIARDSHDEVAKILHWLPQMAGGSSPGSDRSIRSRSPTRALAASRRAITEFSVSAMEWLGGRLSVCGRACWDCAAGPAMGVCDPRLPLLCDRAATTVTSDPVPMRSHFPRHPDRASRLVPRPD